METFSNETHAITIDDGYITIVKLIKKFPYLIVKAQGRASEMKSEGLHGKGDVVVICDSRGRRVGISKELYRQAICSDEYKAALKSNQRSDAMKAFVWS
jgi:hypothetical protein